MDGDKIKMDVEAVKRFRDKKEKMFGKIAYNSTEMFFKVPKRMVENEIKELLNDMENGLLFGDVEIFPDHEGHWLIHIQSKIKK